MSDKSKIWYLSSNKILKGISKEDMMFVEKNSVMKVIDKYRFVYFPEDDARSIYFLKKGKVKIGSYSPDGKEIIKAILKTQEVFGEHKLMGENTRTDFAQAIDGPVILCQMDADQFEDLLNRNATLALKVTKLVGFRLRRIERRFEALIFKDARTRIIDFIRDMAEESGQRIGYETLIKNYLTHNDIARLTATSRQTVTMVLNDLKQKEVIHFDRKKILIRDKAKLI